MRRSPGQVFDTPQTEAAPEEGMVLLDAVSEAVMLPKNGPLQTEQIPPPAAHVAGVIVSDQQDRAPTELLGTKSMISIIHTPLRAGPESPSATLKGASGRNVPT